MNVENSKGKQTDWNGNPFRVMQVERRKRKLKNNTTNRKKNPSACEIDKKELFAPANLDSFILMQKFETNILFIHRA